MVIIVFVKLVEIKKINETIFIKRPMNELTYYNKGGKKNEYFMSKM